MIGFIILCIWTGLFIGLGVCMIIFAKRFGMWAEKVSSVYFKFLYSINFKLFHISEEYWQEIKWLPFKAPSKTWLTKGSIIGGISLIIPGSAFFVIAVWPKG